MNQLVRFGILALPLIGCTPNSSGDDSPIEASTHLSSSEGTILGASEEHWAELVGQQVQLTGKARSHKVGAYLAGTDFGIYVSLKDTHWPASFHPGELVKVSGTVAQHSDLPVFHHDPEAGLADLRSGVPVPPGTDLEQASKRYILVSAQWELASSAMQEEPDPPEGSAKIPRGPGSPEGVACDLAYAFIEADADKFLASCLKPWGPESEAKTSYQAFLDDMVRQFAKVAASDALPPGGPKRILRVYKARKLSLNGPASFGSVFFDLADVQFVDVITERHDGEEFRMRGLVLQAKDGQWCVMPMPAAYPLLSMGLNAESESTELLFETE